MLSVDIYTDGGSRGNPGPAGIGGVIFERGLRERALAEISEYIGETTNNQAEYRALVATLRKAQELGATDVQCFLDSELVTRQMKREYRVKDQGLAPLFVQAWNIAQTFSRIIFQSIPRERNTYADRLVNKALDEYLTRKTL